VSDTVVISGAAALSDGGASGVALLSVPEFAEVAMAERATGMELVVGNRTGAPLRIAVEGIGDIAVPPGASTAVPWPTEPEQAGLHLQALSATLARVVMIIVTVEQSDDGPIAVAQAIGARTC
jgi:hypothetical protein